MKNTIYINNGESFFGSDAWAFLGDDAAKKAVTDMAKTWTKQGEGDLDENEAQGWDNLGDYEFRGTAEQWAELQAANIEQRRDIERMGYVVVEDSRSDVAHIRPETDED